MADTTSEKVLQTVKDYMLTLNPSQRKAFIKKLQEVIENYEGIPF